MLAIPDILEELVQDIRGNNIADLILGIVARENTDQFAVSRDREGVTAGCTLHGCLHLLAEEKVPARKGRKEIDGADGADGPDGITVVLQLPYVHFFTGFCGASGLERT